MSRTTLSINSLPRLGPPVLTAVAPVQVLAPGLLRTERLMLRPMRDSDRAEFLRVIGISREHLKMFSHLHREEETDEQLFDRQLQMCRSGDEHGTAFRRVAVMDDGRIAGCFNLNSISRGLTFECDANWWISADVARRGLGTEGVAALIDHALADLPQGLGLHRVQAAIMPGNTPSIRLAMRVGLKSQPTAKVSIRVGDRWEFHDLYTKSVLDQAYPGIAC